MWNLNIVNEELFHLSRHMLTIHHSPFERYILKDKGLKHRCVILLGQRSIGKPTTLIQHLLHHDVTGKKVLYVPCDHILLGKQTLES